MDYITIVLNTIAILGFIFAIYQTIIALKQQKDAKQQIEAITQVEVITKSQAEAISKLQGSLSTKSIGEFPSYMPALVDLINQANKRIFVVCDYVGYGMFTNRQTFLKYQHAFESKINEEIEVKYVILNKEKRSELHDAQFEKYFKEDAWSDWKNQNKTHLEAFCKFHAKNLTHENITQKDFKYALEDAEQNLFQTMLNGATIREIDFQTAIYFWMSDNNEVIFTIPSFSEEAKEFAFKTVDEKLIQSFKGIFDRYYKMSTEVAIRKSSSIKEDVEA